ncbi:helix-hairpin-helix domain-containing protein [Streptomonospora nanhaiensis]|uniref:helix-hairpin-helix domain-containing protein n=1 Tax=Streptomonospora nanhaiensis TaxID=1323731 RepID=UPI001C992D1A|nr:helix-hairpin-helix domain-containing protein [Streptomonospora nanhaiensis]MBX9387808.1 AAA family ATPase [Streptomonospora nanhaiensis]
MPEAPTPTPSTPQFAGADPEGGAVERTGEVLQRMGAPGSLAAPLVAALGPGAAGELAADPWRLLALGSVIPEQADFCARRALGADASPDDPRRGRALTAHLLRRAAREGHTALEERRLAGALRSLGVRSVDDALTAALDDGDVMLFEMFDEPEDDFTGGDPGEMPDPERWYALTRVGLAEQDLGEGVVRLMGTSEPIMDSATAAETVEATAERLGADIDPRTQAALVTVALRGVCVLTHGAGAAVPIAHTVACAAAVAAVSEVGIAVAAPTAQAAAALNADLADLGAGDDVRAVPLAALLEARAPGVYARGAERPIEAGLVVVAGAMWLDVERAAALVDACADGTHLVLIADPAQAPSAAPGRVVADLVASRVVHVAELPDGPQPGPIARLAALVAGGALEEVSAPEREVVVVPADSGAAAAHRAAQLIGDSIPRALGIPVEQVQLVAATRGGEAGTEALNRACKERFNPGPGTHNGLDVGDRVVVTVDGPGLAAGDVGYLRAEAAPERAPDGAPESVPDGGGAPGVEGGEPDRGRDGAEVGREDQGSQGSDGGGMGAVPGSATGGERGGTRPAGGGNADPRGTGADLFVELPDGSRVPVADVGRLRPGWALTVAAAHGGAWPAVVAVFPPETKGSRPQVYTAVSAARRHLSIVQAAGPALASAVRDNAALNRHTRLVQVLREG